MDVAGSGGNAIASTLTTGIQDISALLPLLGTEQCEEHLASSLTNGYLYAAATPLSIFGSLGAARAGFKTLLSSTSIPRLRFFGAKLLADAGFKPQGTNLSLVMLDEDRKSYCAEMRLESMMKELHLDDSNKISLSSKTRAWNIQMILATAVFSLVSIRPYIHLNLHEPNSLTPFVRWTFPIIRAIGGFLTATMTQLVIQSRILEIARKRLILNGLSEKELSGFGIDVKDETWCSTTLHQHFSVLEQQVRLGVADLEKGASEKIPKERLDSIRDRIIEANGSPILIWIFLIFLLIGIVGSVAGYVGCFSVVQGVRSSQEALYWLCLEAGLSIVRIILWGLNPKGDDAPPLELKVKLDKHSPLPTCTSSANDIEKETVLPLVRAKEFLETITSYAGLVKQFSDPALTLYYTLTRRYADDPQHILRQHVLYITVFHHTERTTRVYTKNQAHELRFSSADPVTVDLEHGVLMTKIGDLIEHDTDPIAGDVVLEKALKEHYHSILGQIDLKFGTGSRPENDTLENVWTLNAGDAKSKLQNLGDEKTDDCAHGEEGQLEGSDRMRDCQYLKQGRLDRNVQYLYNARGQWMTDYMEWLRQKTDDDLREAKEVHRIDMEADEREMVERMLIVERVQMEMMLVDEIYGWEVKLRKSYEDFVHSHKLDAVSHAQRWRTSSWERLEKERLAMEARVDAAKKIFSQRVTDAKEDLLYVQSQSDSTLRDAWKQLLESTHTASSFPPSPRIHLNEGLKAETLVDSWRYREMKEGGRRWCDRGIQKMKSRLRWEAKSVEDRLECGLERCREFKSSRGLIELTHSDSKWAMFNPWLEFEATLHALESRQNVIHLIIIDKYPDDELERIFAATRRMMSCTSICYPEKIPDSVQLPPNILSIYYAELSEAHNDTLEQNQLQSQRTTIEVHGGLLSLVFWFTVRFFGPPSDYLTLRLIHCSSKPENHLTVNDGKYPIPHSDTFILEEFKIWNSTLPNSSQLTFTPGSRNTLKFSPTSPHDYILHDIELLDTNRLPYEPANGEKEGEYSRPPPPGELSLHLDSEAVASGSGLGSSDTSSECE
jgi:hypothetical protein